MRQLVAITLLGLVLLPGCVRSLHPFYTDEDIVFDPNLVGEWANDESGESWTFSKKGEKSYDLVYRDRDGKTGRFVAHLAKIQGKLFLDLFPEEAKIEGNDFYRIHLVRVHTLLHVKQIGPTLQMRVSNPDWLKKLVTDNPDTIRHTEVDDGVILTAETKELQAFWIKHLDTEKAFGEFFDLSRTETRTPETETNKTGMDQGK